MAQWNDRLCGPIPHQFKEVRNDRRLLAVARSDIAELLDLERLTLNDSWHPSLFEGRARLGSVALPNGDTVLVRAYRHGGLLRGITRGWFCSWPPRPFRELAITEEIRRRGVPTVEVYAACVAPLAGPFYRGWLLTKELKGAQDLWTALQTGFARTLGIDRVLAAVARALKALHREGVYHRDLNLKNILVRGEAGKVAGYIIDFDRAILVLGAVPAPLVRKNLSRLLRSACKLDPRRERFSETDWNQFLSYYHDTRAT
ncbi:MAG TPA: lipopolysaccharide kinase InaA family protein [Candidatus Eisenbacteria bacterium]|nr:lipopolysaccharide kinase InaA family protein [Candidatus Eisenbacteria bacterium]